ncbi:hypothetical protein FG91_02787 [Sphingopyxis sp. LC81]|uniref:hypothetical protein n=1 Tax=unclassified Sphingopyxis TaxID=2614943 RepID=UPI00050FF325|nr:MULTISPECIES: hypothetical protein [unclassified Sphingopyxis]KGB53365.1 hypothetical protein FG91_02787 [Sphingopyxis sp. LC81]MDT7531244.1 hypothetical protein [Sphingopyxis sp. SE2]
MKVNERGHDGGGPWSRYLDKLGIAGSVFAALCCLGFPALLSIILALILGSDSAIILYVGIAGLIIASGLNVWLRSRQLRHH